MIIAGGGAANSVLAGKSCLESAAKPLHNVMVGHNLPADSFRLVGRCRIIGIEDPVTQLRIETAAAAEKKLAALSKVP